MGYFDDPKHRAQWEKELSVLRMEKARIQAGLPPVEEQRAASRNLEKSAPENDFVDDKKLDFTEENQREAVEETTIYRASEKEARTPAKPHSERVSADSGNRVRITFEELLREANMYEPPRLTQKPREMTRQKEVSHEL